MKAITIPRYGDPSVLRLSELPDPVPGPGQVLVRVHAASVNALDWHVLRADPWLVRFYTGLWRPRKVPVMGADIAGVVEAVGEGVPYRPGDKVFGDISATGLGGFSELAIATPEQIALMPETSFEAASCLGVAGLTALQMWRHAGLGPGHRVLVVGASGGVGHLAVQVAKAHGAHVTATTTTKKVPFVEALGADVVLDRSTTDAVDHGPYDIILDNGAFRDLRDYVPALSPEGVYVMVGGSGPAMMQALLRGKRIFGKGRCIVKTAKAVHEDLATLSHMVDAGALVPHIDKRFSLHETAEAIAYLEAGTIQGKVVVVMDAVSNP